MCHIILFCESPSKSYSSGETRDVQEVEEEGGLKWGLRPKEQVSDGKVAKSRLEIGGMQVGRQVSTRWSWCS